MAIEPRRAATGASTGSRVQADERRAARRSPQRTWSCSPGAPSSCASAARRSRSSEQRAALRPRRRVLGARAPGPASAEPRDIARPRGPAEHEPGRHRPRRDPLAVRLARPRPDPLASSRPRASRSAIGEREQVRLAPVTCRTLDDWCGLAAGRSRPTCFDALAAPRPRQRDEVRDVAAARMAGSLVTPEHGVAILARTHACGDGGRHRVPPRHVLRRRRRPHPPRRQDRRHHRLRLPGPRPRAEPQGLRRRRRRRPAARTRAPSSRRAAHGLEVRRRSPTPPRAATS